MLKAYMVNRLVAAVLLLALLGAAAVAGCGDSPSQAPPTPKGAAPDQDVDTDNAPSTPEAHTAAREQGTAEAAQDDEFVPPQDWCGTGRVGGRTLEDLLEAFKRESPSPAKTRRLIKALEDKDNDLVRAAAVELGRQNAEGAVPALVQLLETHDDPLVRLDATSALGKMGTADVFPSLIEALSDKNGLVRLAAWHALRSDARYHLPETVDDYSLQMSRAIRRSLLEATQEDIQREWRAWWRDNEKAIRLRIANPR